VRSTELGPQGERERRRKEKGLSRGGHVGRYRLVAEEKTAPPLAWGRTDTGTRGGRRSFSIRGIIPSWLIIKKGIRLIEEEARASGF